MYTTPIYGLESPSPSTKVKDLGAELQRMAVRMEEVLRSFDYNGDDPGAYLARVAALEMLYPRVAALEDTTTPAHPSTVWTNPAAPGANHLVTKIGRMVFVNLHATTTGIFGASSGICWLPAPAGSCSPTVGFYGSGATGSLSLSATGQLATLSVVPIPDATVLMGMFAYETAA